ncbi:MULTISPECIES: PQQ-dependent sugar dehydrogenase [Desulfococcus]|jgi:glucose/arabinose dehydrogenase|uniref:L-sorbosone dehydrogenase n=1 Tax=Desulfococcus multivorans DSM 2059 TaxID=1121405 RepID=S7V758_DESML|nr:sorbosone dehydrogenase family protein [Desulfococcus multivorans]AOY58247.1 glucose/sorbosone dehydrogenase [Desulfococcus multivorans]AQV00591.1 sorbosone dehydrogenase [Desulfococcus multivorans]EPR42499.1 L-sorbosone dehydrogenase [Desulfococcus multivorans DSM 2059]MDX9819370.1 sorbosone dehydrogenase family protein [Desulfococcus multivorans]SJZ97358.1 Glucose/arabinose dehydrogenase, beta-propeller fold [Desulfococcus multivorans DSM 2059]
MNPKIFLMVVIVLFGFEIPNVQAKTGDVPLERIRMPEGFHIQVFADDIPDARSMVLAPGRTLFVGTRRAGKVYAVRDTDGNFKADEILTVASGLNSPNGVAIHNGDLYVAEIHRVIKFPDIERNLDRIPSPVVVRNDFPKDRSHGWKFIAFGPDGMLYVPVGAPCNICRSRDPRYAALHRMRPDGTGLKIFAEGIRNTVGFDWHPETGELWFTDNGRDRMGDDIPPDELNHAPRKGLHFGYPFQHGKNIPDPEYGGITPPRSLTPPVQELGPHVAALGMRFYTGKQFPAEYRNQILIAEHGSWNRTEPIGYRITRVFLEGNRSAEYEVFAEGWLHQGSVWGRPVDLLVMPDGSILVSDDYGGRIYRIHYRP